MIYILEELQSQHSIIDIAELKTLAVLQTNEGLRRPVDDPVHFSVAYSGYDLITNLPGYGSFWLSASLPQVSTVMVATAHSTLA